jgi:hypothetical protein
MTVRAIREPWPTQGLVLILVQLSIIRKSRTCIKDLVITLQSAHELRPSAKEPLPLVITRILVKACHQRTLTNSLGQVPSLIQVPIGFIHTDKVVHLLTDLLSCFTEVALSMWGTIPNCLLIHYVAHYGLLDVYQFF